MKRGTPKHPKARALARRLRIPLPHAVGMLALLWDYASDSCPDGGVGRMSDEDIAEVCGWPERRAAELVAALTDENSKWLDELENCRLYIHDWHEHCEDTVHRKLARAGKFFANGEMPKLTRLSDKDRKDAERAYAQRAPYRAQDSAQGAHDVRTKCALPLPQPQPLPEPAPTPSQSQPSQSGEALIEQCPETRAAVREYFKTADPPMVFQIHQAGVRTITDLMKSPPDEAAVDALIARAVHQAKREAPKQRSPALFLRTVPQVIRTWGTTEVH